MTIELLETHVNNQNLEYINNVSMKTTSVELNANTKHPQRATLGQMNEYNNASVTREFSKSDIWSTLITNVTR